MSPPPFSLWSGFDPLCLGVVWFSRVFEPLLVECSCGKVNEVSIVPEGFEVLWDSRGTPGMCAFGNAELFLLGVMCMRV